MDVKPWAHLANNGEKGSKLVYNIKFNVLHIKALSEFNEYHSLDVKAKFF